MPEDIEKLVSVAETSPPPCGLPHSLVRAGLYHQPPGCDPNPYPVREGVEVVELVTGGRGWLWAGETWHEVVPGALLWHQAGDYTIGRSDWENPYRCLAVHFDVRQRRPRPVEQITWWPDRESALQFVRELLRLSVDERSDREALLQYAHGRLLFQARWWSLQRRGQAVLPTPLTQAMKRLEQGLAGKTLLREVAQEVGWSVSHLHGMFRTHLKVTPHQFVLERRMHRAKERLVASNHSVKEIAAEVGFANAAGFCHAFRQRVGLTPLEYRRQSVPGFPASLRGDRTG